MKNKEPVSAGIQMCSLWHLLSQEDDVEVNVEGRVVKDWCHILLNGTGFLNDWKCGCLVIESAHKGTDT